MKTITMEDAQTNFDHYLAEVEAGETFVITLNGNLVAQLVAAVSASPSFGECNLLSQPD